MADTLLVAKLVDGIEAHDESVAAKISALSDHRLIDASNRTLLDVAIQSDNTAVIALLASDADALEYSAPVDVKTKDSIKHATAMRDIAVPISTLEAYLEQSFGKTMAYGRTPLHTASRVGNTSAMETLLAAGAKTNAKDATGLTAPELAYFARGETGLIDFLNVFERGGRVGLPVGKRLLGETFQFPETMAKLLEVAKLDAAAQRLLFCYRCAWLDIDAVHGMLADGQDPNKGVTAELNPLWQACTSAMLWNDEISGGFEMAFHYTKHVGHPGASAVSFDNDLLNEDASNFGELFAEAQRKQSAQIEMVNEMTLAPDAEREVVGQRIALLDVLLDAGADLTLARKKLDFVTFSDLKKMKLGDIAAHLKRRGGRGAKAKQKRKPAASTTWELLGETGLNTEYWPENGKGGLLRLILYNLYGPVDGIMLSVRLSQGESKPDGDWHDLKPVTETVEVEGEQVARVGLTEPIYGESPWEANFEFPLHGTGDGNVLWIRLDHEQDEQLRGELDPWTFVKG